jgi:hypothetical protein
MGFRRPAWPRSTVPERLTSQHLGSLQKIAEGHALLAENQQAPIATK